LCALIGGGIAFNCALSLAQGIPPGWEGKALPTYKHDPSACYVILRRQWPYVRSGNYPVCRAVAEELNRSCGDPPQYDVRKFRSTPEGIVLPDWKPLDAVSNLDLIKQVQWVNATPDSVEANWTRHSEQARARAASGTLKLFRTTVAGIDFRGGVYTAYRVENPVPGGDVGSGYNQPRLMISERDKQAPSEMFQRLHTAAPINSELFQFKGQWFVFGFDRFERRFIVSEFVWAGTPGPVGMRAVCSIHHISDRPEGK
jgi:hypothetical protein